MRVGKNSWPELVGANGKEAEEQIERENRNVDAIVVREGTGVDEVFRCDRVWVGSMIMALSLKFQPLAN
ncbi:hypothetical protein TIFTF001_040540 [Ficus carica]|uniref:Uncharacterized protein n=1 Tax=Ficus carica TaxID=3494 RepID=A0AA87Z4M4_FICCA|nr:hypothetical protein TIFTF001_040540 [Ficus carica]